MCPCQLRKKSCSVELRNAKTRESPGRSTKVDYKVSIYPINFNRCNVTDTFLHGVARYVFNVSNALNVRSAEHDVAGITARIFTTLENSENVSNRSFSCIVQAFLKQSSRLIRAQDENSPTFSSRLPGQVFHFDRYFPKHRVLPGHFG